MKPDRVDHHVRFSTFVLNLRTRELFRNGSKVKLRGQPIDLLEILLRHPGELVTRQELQKSLWRGETFVDFEHVLNNDVRRLREALGDDAEVPQFIETLPRLGYRFITPVEDDENRYDEKPNASQELTVSADSVAVRGRRSAKRRELSRRLQVLAAALAVIVFIAAGIVWYVRRPSGQPHIANMKPIAHNLRAGELLGTDGEHLYVSEYSSSCLNGSATSSELVSIRVSDGTPTPIPLSVPWPHEACTFLGPVSPDGSYVLAGGYDGSAKESDWLFSTSGTPIRSLPGSAFQSAWSSDGRLVVYSTIDGSVYSIPREGGKPHLIASKLLSQEGVPPSLLAMSSDGRRIRFTRDDGTWEMQVDNSKLKRVLDGMPMTCCGRWTPDGAFYIFFSTRSLDRDQIWALDERRFRLRDPSANPVQLTSEPTQWVPPVIISKDGRTLYARGILKQGELLRFDRATGEFHRFLNGISAEWLEFSPDGKYVAYISFPDYKLWRADSRGNGKILLAEPQGQPYGVHWSPDGTRILFGTWLQSERREEIYVVPSGGGALKMISLAGTMETSDPTWSPDGKRLAYAVTSKYRDHPNGIRIHDVESGTSFALPQTAKPVWSPRWSPDGRYIFGLSHYEFTLDSRVEIQVFDVQKKKWSVFPQRIDVHYPHWSRDSRFVYFIQMEMGRAGVYRISIPAGQIDLVADLKDLKITGAFGGSWLGLDAEDTPLVLHDIGIDEIYAISLERD